MVATASTEHSYIAGVCVCCVKFSYDIACDKCMFVLTVYLTSLYSSKRSLLKVDLTTFLIYASYLHFIVGLYKINSLPVVITM